MDEVKPQTTKEKLKAIFPQGLNPPKPAEVRISTRVEWMNAFRDWYPQDVPPKKGVVGFLKRSIGSEQGITFNEYAVCLVSNLGGLWDNWAKKAPNNRYQEQLQKYRSILNNAHNKAFPLNELIDFLLVAEPAPIEEWGTAVRQNVQIYLKQQKII